MTRPHLLRFLSLATLATCALSAVAARADGALQATGEGFRPTAEMSLDDLAAEVQRRSPRVQDDLVDVEIGAEQRAVDERYAEPATSENGDPHESSLASGSP